MVIEDLRAVLGTPFLLLQDLEVSVEVQWQPNMVRHTDNTDENLF